MDLLRIKTKIFSNAKHCHATRLKFRNMFLIFLTRLVLEAKADKPLLI